MTTSRKRTFSLAPSTVIAYERVDCSCKLLRAFQEGWGGGGGGGETYFLWSCSLALIPETLWSLTTGLMRGYISCSKLTTKHRTLTYSHSLPSAWCLRGDILFIFAALGFRLFRNVKRHVKRFQKLFWRRSWWSGIVCPRTFQKLCSQNNFWNCLTFLNTKYRILSRGLKKAFCGIEIVWKFLTAGQLVYLRTCPAAGI